MTLDLLADIWCTDQHNLYMEGMPSLEGSTSLSLLPPSQLALGGSSGGLAVQFTVS